MNILLMTSWYPNKNHIINGVFVREQAKALLKVGLKPIVFYPNDNTVASNTLIQNYEDGITVYRANTYYLKNSKISRIYSIIKSIIFLNKIVKLNKIDLIHCHVCYPAGFSTALCAKLNKIPFIITEHMSYLSDYAKKIYNRILLKYAYSHANLVICVSSALENEIKSLGFNFKSEILGNVVDTDIFFENDNKLHNKEENSFKILFIGSMYASEVKGLQYFIPALSRVIKSNPNLSIKVSFIGEGAKKNDYMKLCRDLNIESMCSFYGLLPNEEISNIMNEHDFLVLPSIKETFGCVLIENMAVGKPVLSTCCGGPNEFVTEELGVLVKPGSILELEYGLNKIITEYNTFDSKVIRKFVVDNYSDQIIGAKLKQIYSNILRK